MPDRRNLVRKSPNQGHQQFVEDGLVSFWINLKS